MRFEARVRFCVIGCLLQVLAIVCVCQIVAAQAALSQTPDSQTTASQTTEPLPVRHDIPQAGREFLVLRHQRLVKGSHQRFYELSRDAVWPFYEKIGARVVGQWQVVHPEGGGPEGYDEGYRLARYRSFNHWVATRRPQELGGNGPDFRTAMEAIRARNELRLGSDGAVFLEGEVAPGGPYYMPPLDESYEFVEGEASEAGGPGGSDDAEAPRPVRHDVARRGTEIFTLRYFKIAKGSFEEFYRLSRDGVWPYFEKMGARVVGQWRVVYPEVGGAGTAARAEAEEYDEVQMLVRYASYEHWRATRPAVMAALGGDGEDYEACREALDRRRRLTVETSVRLLEGGLYFSPPVYLPPLEERYRPRDQPR